MLCKMQKKQNKQQMGRTNGDGEAFFPMQLLRSKQLENSMQALNWCPVGGPRGTVQFSSDQCSTPRPNFTVLPVLHPLTIAFVSLLQALLGCSHVAFLLHLPSSYFFGEWVCLQLDSGLG